jgi:hypothetical protein
MGPLKTAVCSVLNSPFILAAARGQLSIAVWAKKTKVLWAIVAPVAVDVIER